MKTPRSTRSSRSVNQRSILEAMELSSPAKENGDGTTVKPTDSGSQNQSRQSKRKRNALHAEKQNIVHKQACDELIELATYELEVDPYRGIFETGASNSWTKCSRALQVQLSTDETQVRPSPLDENGIEIDVGIDIDVGMEDSFNNFGEMISCPCVQHWIRDEMEKREAAAERARKAKRRKSGIGMRGKPRTKRKKDKNGNGNGKAPEVVNIDVDVDDVDATTTSTNNPTTGMESDESTSLEVIVLDQDSSNSDNQNGKTASACASKDDKSEMTLVRRDPNTNFTCECDYNPFCLASLGGVMDDYLNALINNYSQKNISSTHTGTQTSTTKAETVITDVESSFEKSEEVVENSSEKSQEVTPKIIKELTPTKSLKEENDNEVSIRSDETISLCTSIIESNGSCEDPVLRNAVSIELETITKHMRANLIIEENEEQIQERIEELLAAAQEWHHKLIYSGNKREAKEGKFTYCRPVGLRNLGATCYLNSQLQCLATNLTLLDGVFNWTQEDNDENKNNRMNKVISQMQSLLARMVCGPQNVVCTDSFAAAMSLENNEMQDPNEFARLLFDRMHESFQKIPSMNSLLPNIFRGVFAYGTKCMRCNRVSRREEDFMDLNLPIIRNEKNSSKEITVEMLLEDYFKAEVMEGENKYQCGHCKDACEAERAVEFKTTPNVLNIQLARYVFDTQTFRKKKLMDNILLPRTLYVNKQCGGKMKYILCGVQNHRGTSAYSGHYVAEVMDWSTGVWFEYNDEKVAVLEHGPSSSYDPSRISTTRLKGGNPDAYNLFYAEEHFLRDSARKRIGYTSTSPTRGVIHDISIERQDTYDLHTDIYVQNQKVSGRLKRRKAAIMKSFFQNDVVDTSSSNEPCIWVEGSTLRRFFSCTDPMDDLLSSHKPILRHKELLCKHGSGLHPRVARCGKLLSLGQYKVYLKLLQSERKENLQAINDSEIKTLGTDTVCDLMINRESCLYCSECANEYKKEIKEKLTSYCRLVILEETLHPDVDNSSVLTQNSDVFAISRSFATAFRKWATKKLKQSLSTKSCKKKLGRAIAPVDGIDHYDQTYLSPGAIDSEVVKKSNDKDALDPYINSKIVCEHGHCEKINNKQVVRFVKAETWNDLSALFPHAISIPVHQVNGKAKNCILCTEGKNFASSLFQQLVDWVGKFSTPLSKDTVNITAREEPYRFVSTSDITTLKKVFTMVKNCRKRDTVNFEKLKDRIVNALYLEPSSIDPNSLQIQRLTCAAHAKPLLSIKAFQDMISFSETSFQAAKYSEEVSLSVLSEENYNLYIESLWEIHNILYLEKNEEPCPYESFKNKLQVQHPQIEMKMVASEEMHDSDIEINNLLHNVMNSTDKDACFTRPLCSSTTCVEDYHQYMATSTVLSNPSSGTKHTNNCDDEIEIFESDDICYEIHEYDGSADLDQIKTMLEKIWNEQMDGIEVVQSSIRRSSRRKSAAYSPNTFKIFGKKTDNLAQFRLQIYEKSINKKISTHRLSTFSFDNSSREGIMDELASGWNERQMDSVLSSIPTPTGTDNGAIHIVLSTHAWTSTDQSPGNGEDNDESIFDSLVQTATDCLVQTATDCQSPNNNSKGTRKRRREERGFAGTFLQSSFHESEPPAISTIDNENIKYSPQAARAEVEISIDHSDDDMQDIQNKNVRTSSSVVMGLVDTNTDQAKGENKNKKEESTNATIVDKFVELNIPQDLTKYPVFDFIYEQEPNASLIPPSNLVHIPDVPSYQAKLELFSKAEVKEVFANVERALKSDEESEVDTAKMMLRFDSNARNLYRNFVGNNLSESDNSNDIPVSRGEMDIVLYYLSKKSSSEDCQAMSSSEDCQATLIPYRSSTTIRYLLKLIKELGILENPKYERYMAFVNSYVGMVLKSEMGCPT